MHFHRSSASCGSLSLYTLSSPMDLAGLRCRLCRLIFQATRSLFWLVHDTCWTLGNHHDCAGAGPASCFVELLFFDHTIGDHLLHSGRHEHDGIHGVSWAPRGSWAICQECRPWLAWWYQRSQKPLVRWPSFDQSWGKCWLLRWCRQLCHQNFQSLSHWATCSITSFWLSGSFQGHVIQLHWNNLGEVTFFGISEGQGQGLLFMIETRGFWSVTTPTFSSPTRSVEFVEAHAIARGSFSIWTLFFSTGPVSLRWMRSAFHPAWCPQQCHCSWHQHWWWLSYWGFSRPVWLSWR